MDHWATTFPNRCKICLYMRPTPGGPTRMSRGYQARPKIHVIRAVFQDRHCTCVHRLGVQKHAKLEKRVCFWSYVTCYHKMSVKSPVCIQRYSLLNMSQNKGKSTLNIDFCWTKQGAVITYHMIF